MNIGTLRRMRVLGLVVFILCVSTQVDASAQVQKSVLLIYDTRSDMLSNMVIDRVLRGSLYEEFGDNLDIDYEFLEATLSPQRDFPSLLTWLHQKYAGKTFDVVVPVGSNSLSFVVDYGRELFHDAPVVFWGRRIPMEPIGSATPMTGLIAPQMDTQVRGTFEFVRALQPDVDQLFVATGASAIDRSWESTARRELAPFETGLHITYLAALSLEELQKRLAGLSRKAAVLFLSMSEDGAGRRLLRTQFLSKAVEVSNAPVYSTGAAYLETGIVGGALLDQEAMATDTARMVARVLRGEDVRQLRVSEPSLIPMVNWNAMKRWGLRADRLPQGTIVRYREPSIWETYRWHIVGAILLFALQASLIVGLLIHRSQRRKAQKGMDESKLLLQSTMDALNARVALVDSNGSIVAVNRRWTSYMDEHRFAGMKRTVGYNYFARGPEQQSDEAVIVANGLRSVMSGELEDFRCVYPSPATGSTTWFQVRINQFDMNGELRLVVAHEDVTEIKQAHDSQQQVTALLMRAQDEERRRIARDLHDVTVQNMVAIKADLTGVRLAAHVLNDGVSSDMLNESVTLCDEVIKELRTLSYLLHPPFLDEAGLIPAIQWFVRGFFQRSKVQVELIVREDIGRLPEEVETALFRVVQESLTNIHRHSGSTNAVIWVTKEKDAVVLRITDDGHGFSPSSVAESREASSSPGVGIAGMRQRLKQLGGELRIESDSQGTTIHARVSISEGRSYAYSSR
jgi:signal transduction histidine kinase/ABC-type uncharacterized transport system substrate-binding protein